MESNCSLQVIVDLIVEQQMVRQPESEQTLRHLRKGLRLLHDQLVFEDVDLPAGLLSTIINFITIDIFCVMKLINLEEECLQIRDNVLLFIVHKNMIAVVKVAELNNRRVRNVAHLLKVNAGAKLLLALDWLLLIRIKQFLLHFITLTSIV